MLAWHYTTGEKFPSILASGELLPTAIGVKPPEKPVLWFSLNQYWENTANKSVYDENGNARRLSMREHLSICDGLVRFGYEAKNLHVGEALRRKAAMSAAVWRDLWAEGRRQKATPSDWCGSIMPIPVPALVVEVMSNAFKWERIEV